jgi:hypothetical protein
MRATKEGFAESAAKPKQQKLFLLSHPRRSQNDTIGFRTELRDAVSWSQRVPPIQSAQVCKKGGALQHVSLPSTRTCGRSSREDSAIQGEVNTAGKVSSRWSGHFRSLEESGG